MEGNISCTGHSNLNFTFDEDAAKAALYSATDTVIVTLVMPCIMAIGHVGNSAFLFVMCRVKSMRTVTNFYLTNLAISDICFLSIAVGEKIWRYKESPVTIDQSAFGTLGCVLVYFFMNMTFFASIFLVTLVSVEKYCCVCLPLRHLKMSGKNRTVTLITLAWLFAVAFAACIIPGSSVMHIYCIIWPDSESGIYDDLPTTVGVCCAENEVWEIAYQGIQTVPFFVCLVINYTLYTKIISRLHRRATQNPTLTHKGSAYASHIRQRNQMSHMLIATGVLFFLCLAPFQVLSCLNMIWYAVTNEDIIKNSEVNSIVFNVFRVLVYLNSAINPIVYNVTNARYRLSFKDAFSCNDEARRRRYRSNMSSPQISRQSSGRFDTFHLATANDQIRAHHLELPD